MASPIRIEIMIISPVDERAGSVNYIRNKYEQAMVLIGKLQDRPVLPSECGEMEPRPLKKNKGVKRITINTGHGSIRITKGRERKHEHLAHKELEESLSS